MNFNLHSQEIIGVAQELSIPKRVITTNYGQLEGEVRPAIMIGYRETEEVPLSIDEMKYISDSFKDFENGRFEISPPEESFEEMLAKLEG